MNVPFFNILNKRFLEVPKYGFRCHFQPEFKPQIQALREKISNIILSEKMNSKQGEILP